MEERLSRDQAQRALLAEMHRTLYPVALALSVLYALFAVSHPFAVGGATGWILTGIAAGTAMSLAVVVRVLRRTPPQARPVALLVALVTVLACFNSLIHLILTADPLQSTNLMLALMAAGYLLLDTRAFVLVTLSFFVVWGVVAWQAPPAPEWAHFTFAMVTALLLGTLIHFVRKDATLRTERLRLGEEHLKHALERALADKDAAYLEARDQADQKAYTLDVVSHEVRTPLTGIMGFADLLERETEGEQASFARLIGSSARRLHETLNAFLDLSRLDAGQVETHLRPVDLGAATLDLLAAFRPLADQKGLALSLTTPPGPPIVLLLDPVFFDRIVSNLIANAVKFTVAGEVAVRVWHVADRAGVTVEDTGPGIDPTFLPHVFEPFRQASAGLTRVHQGSGLGLAIVRRLTHLMGGEVTASNRAAGGTCFTVSFPRTRAGSARNEEAGPSM